MQYAKKCEASVKKMSICVYSNAHSTVLFFNDVNNPFCFVNSTFAATGRAYFFGKRNFHIVVYIMHYLINPVVGFSALITDFFSDLQSGSRRNYLTHFFIPFPLQNYDNQYSVLLALCDEYSVQSALRVCLRYKNSTMTLEIMLCIVC